MFLESFIALDETAVENYFAKSLVLHTHAKNL